MPAHKISAFTRAATRMKPHQLKNNEEDEDQVQIRNQTATPRRPEND